MEPQVTAEELAEVVGWYILYEPRQAGHAAAHKRLVAATLAYIKAREREPDPEGTP